MSAPVMPDRLRLPTANKVLKTDELANAVNAALREVRIAFQNEIKSLKDRADDLEARVEALENA